MENSHHWPQRPWLLAGLLGLVGLVLYFITDDFSRDLTPAWSAFAVLVLTTGLTFAYVLERGRELGSLLFALAWGTILGGIAWWVSDLSQHGFEYSWPLFSGIFAVTLAVPLFQTAQAAGRLKFNYTRLHAFAWADVVSWFTAWAFVGISFLLLQLLAALFDLIGLTLLKELLRETWFNMIFVGTSFGAALGILKENERIVASLQSLLMTVLSVLAPVMAAALTLFIGSLPFTGLQPLWNATDATTPILLSCAAGALLLLNAILRDDDQEVPDNRLLRIAAPLLAASILPLALIAWVSMQQRVTQYGLSPERIWGLLSVGVAFLYGLAYLVVLVLKRGHWFEAARNWNTRIAIVLCGLMLLLAMPFIDFGAWSAHNQMQRLADGRTAQKDFDYAAFAFQFGQTGRDILEELKESPDTEVATAATIALQADRSWDANRQIDQMQSQQLSFSKLKILPENTELPTELLSTVNGLNACLGDFCILHWQPNTEHALLITSECQLTIPAASEYKACPPTVFYLDKNEGGWVSATEPQYRSVNYRRYNQEVDAEAVAAEKKQTQQAVDANDIEIRDVQRKQLFIGGKPVGEAFR